MGSAIFMRSHPLVAISTIVFSSFLLSACDPSEQFYDDTIEIRVTSGGDLQFVVCDAIEAVGGTASISKGPSGKWSDFWVAEGNSAIAAGTIATFGSSPLGLAASLDEVPQIASGDTISIAVYSDSARGASGGVLIENVDPITDKWVSSAGNVSSTPCATDQ